MSLPLVLSGKNGPYIDGQREQCPLTSLVRLPPNRQLNRSWASCSCLCQMVFDL
ncbi:unnamed protein product [Staurois parvus]|uniref:Uncharacterized protein n=1 Tax=Staurois parvus TaxID=386267 RepID=A0ABN9GNN5_9NEOB|nr:unnamed protein product [Staurois parvus]